MKYEPAIQESLALDAIYKTKENYEEEKVKFVESILAYRNRDVQEELIYIASEFFENMSIEEVDMDYVFAVWTTFDIYKTIVQQKVDQYKQTFSFDQMDVLDQAIFILGYAEFKLLNTPKEILLNELVELAKRYAHEWAAKLVNGIMHKICEEW